MRRRLLKRGLRKSTSLVDQGRVDQSGGPGKGVRLDVANMAVM